MRLCDRDILKALEDKKIDIQPMPDKEVVSGVTVDLRLGNKFRVFNCHTVPFIDLSGTKSEIEATIEKVMSDEIVITDNNVFMLHPGELALGVTLESVTLADDIVGWLDGRSSLARLGLMVHVTAGRIDPGWNGNIVLEFMNAGKIPLALQPGMGIGAISFEKMSGNADRPYRKRADAKYKIQNGPIASRISKD